MRHYFTTEITFTTADDDDDNPYADGTVGSLTSEHKSMIEAWGWMEFQRRKVKGIVYAEIRHHMESDFDKTSAVVWKKQYR